MDVARRIAHEIKTRLHQLLVNRPFAKNIGLQTKVMPKNSTIMYLSFHVRLMI